LLALAAVVVLGLVSPITRAQVALPGSLESGASAAGISKSNVQADTPVAGAAAAASAPSQAAAPPGQGQGLVRDASDIRNGRDDPAEPGMGDADPVGARQGVAKERSGMPPDNSQQIKDQQAANAAARRDDADAARVNAAEKNGNQAVIARDRAALQAEARVESRDQPALGKTGVDLKSVQADLKNSRTDQGKDAPDLRSDRRDVRHDIPDRKGEVRDLRSDPRDLHADRSTLLRDGRNASSEQTAHPDRDNGASLHPLPGNSAPDAAKPKAGFRDPRL
jgi:hypothetical protein